MFENFWEKLTNALTGNTQFLAEALANTLIIAFLGFVIGILIGTAVAVLGTLKTENPFIKGLNYLCKAYILVVRGTPIMVQLLLLYFVILPALQLPALLIAVIAFGINSGAYMAETLRGAINSIDKGQAEAGRALGLSYSQTTRLIILPQAYKNVIPQLGNEIITLVKETSVVGFITVIDITRAAQLIVAKTYDAIVPYIMLAAIYLLIVYLLTLAIKLVERKVFSYGK